MAKHNELGEKGEYLAYNYLQEKGYAILAKNWRFGKLEVDLVAEIKDYIVFVEVKTRSYSEILEPEKSVTKKKQRQIIKAAHHYILENDTSFEARFDIISILITSRGNTIQHIESAFYPLAK